MKHFPIQVIRKFPQKEISENFVFEVHDGYARTLLQFLVENC